MFFLLLIVKVFNHLVRKIDALGQMHIVAGNGLRADAGDGVVGFTDFLLWLEQQ